MITDNTDTGDFMNLKQTGYSLEEYFDLKLFNKIPTGYSTLNILFNNNPDFKKYTIGRRTSHD